MRNTLPDLDIKLKQIRAERSWAQEDLAREIGVSLSTVQRWEKQGAKPNRLAQKTLIKLIKTMGHTHQHTGTLKPVLPVPPKKEKTLSQGKSPAISPDTKC
jgi:DNA-binding XRE family transcriptional regulator